MESPKQLANRYRELISGKWVTGTNYQEVLSSTTLEMATQKIGNINTIALLTFHVDYYINGLNQVFEGGGLDIRDKFSFDLPELKSEEDWETLWKKFISNSEKFANHVEQLSEEKLNAVFFDKNYGDFRRNIEAMIEHCYYHLGQIVLIKKLLEERR